LSFFDRIIGSTTVLNFFFGGAGEESKKKLEKTQEISEELSSSTELPSDVGSSHRDRLTEKRER
jgi:hypothetical protein